MTTLIDRLRSDPQMQALYQRFGFYFQEDRRYNPAHLKLAEFILRDGEVGWLKQYALFISDVRPYLLPVQESVRMYVDHHLPGSPNIYLPLFIAALDNGELTTDNFLVKSTEELGMMFLKSWEAWHGKLIKKDWTGTEFYNTCRYPDLSRVGVDIIWKANWHTLQRRTK